MSRDRPVRVLHVVGNLDIGGIEMWLLQLARHFSDRSRVAIDVVSYTANGSLASEYAASGASVLTCDRPGRLIRYSRQLQRLIRRHGPYDVVHAHLAQRSGLIVRIARRAGVPIRVAHSHADHAADFQDRSIIWRAVYLSLMRRWLTRDSTDFLAASDVAGRSLFGHAWRRSDAQAPRCRVLPCAIDTMAFHEAIDPSEVRAALGFSPASRVVGHVGRFAEEKNHRLIVDVMSYLTARSPGWQLLLIGEGPLESESKRHVVETRLVEHVKFAGRRRDVADLLRSAMDVFVFPSHHEGLGLAAVEAQAAGLPTLLSDAVPREAIVVPELCSVVPLSSGPAGWARAIERALQSPPSIGAEEALRRVEASDFALQNGAAALETFYRGALAREAEHIHKVDPA